MEYEVENAENGKKSLMTEEDLTKYLGIWMDGTERFKEFIQGDDKEMDIYVGGTIKCMTIRKVK